MPMLDNGDRDASGFLREWTKQYSICAFVCLGLPAEATLASSHYFSIAITYENLSNIFCCSQNNFGGSCEIGNFGILHYK